MNSRTSCRTMPEEPDEAFRDPCAPVWRTSLSLLAYAGGSRSQCRTIILHHPVPPPKPRGPSKVRNGSYRAVIASCVKSEPAVGHGKRLVRASNETHTAVAAQTKCPLLAEVWPRRGRCNRFGACWPRLRVQRRAHRAAAARDEHWRANGGARSFPNRRGASGCVVGKILHAGDRDRHGQRSGSRTGDPRAEFLSKRWLSDFEHSAGSTLRDLFSALDLAHHSAPQTMQARIRPLPCRKLFRADAPAPHHHDLGQAGRLGPVAGRA